MQVSAQGTVKTAGQTPLSDKPEVKDWCGVPSYLLDRTRHKRS